MAWYRQYGSYELEKTTDCVFFVSQVAVEFTAHRNFYLHDPE